jgi:hypothetical protein
MHHRQNTLNSTEIVIFRTFFFESFYRHCEPSGQCNELRAVTSSVKTLPQLRQEKESCCRMFPVRSHKLNTLIADLFVQTVSQSLPFDLTCCNDMMETVCHTCNFHDTFCVITVDNRVARLKVLITTDHWYLAIIRSELILQERSLSLKSDLLSFLLPKW